MAHERQNEVRIFHPDYHQNTEEESANLGGSRGYGIYANQKFQKNEVVMVGRALHVEDVPGTHTIQIGWDQHAFLDLPARFVNHVCGIANVGIVKSIHLTPSATMASTNTDNLENSAEGRSGADDEDNQRVEYYFIALSTIEQGQEILWDYECSEYELAGEGFECRCGSTLCRERIRGYKYHHSHVRAAYGDQYIAPYLLEHRNRSNDS